VQTRCPASLFLIISAFVWRRRPRPRYSVDVSRVLISGASGLIGSKLVPSLEAHGCQVTRLVRQPPRDAHELQWDPMRPIPPELVSGFDAVIHLSGESVVGRWTEAKKNLIRQSRVVSTQNLSQALANAERQPKTFICASAIGYYGNRGDETLTEESPSGDGFLPEVCREWEAATKTAADAGIRTVNLRIGLVLSREGGALKPMLLPFRLGLGGRIGNGRQWWSWIHIDDIVSAIHHILQNASNSNEERRGSSPGHPTSRPINMTSPNPVTNADFTRILARAVNRPAILPFPAFAVRLAFGELANEGILASARVVPKKLIESGFEFKYRELRPALEALLNNA
jgi:uncharacterized protein (TIGR01777 family)